MDLDKDVYYGFLLLLTLIVVVYYVGSTQLAQTLFNGGVNLSYALSGRNNQGQFAAYPGGGSVLTTGTTGANGG